MKSIQEPEFLILGVGYTLQRTVERMPSGTAILTTRALDCPESLKKTGHVYEQLDLSKSTALSELLNKYPSVRCIIDGVPPPVSEYGKPIQDKNLYPNSLKSQVHRIDRIIYLSTTGVFGRNDGSLVDEQTKPQPQFAGGANRLAIEEAYRSLGCPVTALRIPAIYGPGRGIGCSIRDGRYALLGDGLKYSNRIHVEDLANIIFLLANKYKTDLPPILCVTDDAPTQSKEITEFYCQKFNLKHPGYVTEEEARQRGLFTMLSNQRVSNALLKNTLNITLKYPSFREGAATEFEE